MRPPTGSRWCTPGTSRARPTWRSARRWRRDSRRPSPWCPAPACSTPARRLLTAYGMNAPVLGLIGQIPADGHRPRPRPPARDPRPDRHRRPPGRPSCRHRRPGRGAGQGRASAFRAMATRRPGPAVLECAIDIWGQRGAGRRHRAAGRAAPPEDRRRRRARRGAPARQGQARPHRRRRRRAGRLARGHAALRHAAGAGPVLPARPRRALGQRALSR